MLPGDFGDAKGFGYADDVLLMPNQAGSQRDALAHIFWRGRMYNGYPAHMVTAQGAQRQVRRLQRMFRAGPDATHRAVAVRT